MVRACLQLSEDFEQRTSLQKSGCWNEEINFKGYNYHIENHLFMKQEFYNMSYE